MKKLVWRYVLLIFTCLLAQAAMGRLELGQWFTPLLYVAPLVVLPTTTRPIVVLILGAVLGLFADVVMGTVALNVIAAMATAMIRRPLMRITIDAVILRKRNPVIPYRVGQRSFWAFMMLLIGAHSIIFFAFETLTFCNFHYTLGRIAVAWIIAVGFTWLVAKIIPRKIR